MLTRYIPIEVEPKVPCTGMDLYDLRHTSFNDCGDQLVAYYSLPTDNDDMIRISFAHVDIIRVLDEVYISTEENEVEIKGLVRHHFAYQVENSRFWLAQSEFYRFHKPNAVNYRFVTGSACLDVLTTVEPHFSVVGGYSRFVEP